GAERPVRVPLVRCEAALQSQGVAVAGVARPACLAPLARAPRGWPRAVGDCCSNIVPLLRWPRFSKRTKRRPVGSWAIAPGTSGRRCESCGPFLEGVPGALRDPNPPGQRAVSSDAPAAGFPGA